MHLKNKNIERYYQNGGMRGASRKHPWKLQATEQL